jgi:hypothetical protein
MNSTFNMNRFRLLVRRQWTENKKVYLLLWGVISLSLVGLTIFSEKYDLYMLHILLFCFGGCVMVTTLFSRWTDFGRSSFFLLLPASSAEKFLCGLFYGLILFIPVYILNFLFIKYIVTYLFVLLFPNNLLPFSDVILGGIHEIASIPFSFWIVVFLSFLFTQSLCMITFLSFKRRQILILLLTIMGILVLYNSGMPILMSNIAHIQRGHVITPGMILTFMSPEFGYYVLSADNHANTEYFSFIKLIRHLNNLIWLVVFFIIYLTAGYKLKEREL